MPWSSAHTEWLVKTSETLTTADGRTVEVWDFKYDENIEGAISEWAKHFRNHYCLDSEIDLLRNGTGFDRKTYLERIKFPDVSSPPGPSIRSGDFGEILVADFLEFLRKFWVPRTRYGDKTTRNESTKGSDVVGFYFAETEIDSPNDTLAIFETKAQLSGNKPSARLQDAVNDSAKDCLRKAESLNAIKQRLLHGKDERYRNVERFQNEVDYPYNEIYGAVAIFEGNLYDSVSIMATDSTGHPYKSNLMLIVIKGDKLMELVHKLYRRAADEA